MREPGKAHRSVSGSGLEEDTQPALPRRLVAKTGMTLVSPWMAARQAPLSMGFSRQQYWSGLPYSLLQGTEGPSAPCTLASTQGGRGARIHSTYIPFLCAFSTASGVIVSDELSRDGGGNGSPLQYSCLENPMDRGAWRATVHGVTESQTPWSH